MRITTAQVRTLPAKRFPLSCPVVGASPGHNG
jgi:hypothetical protein